MERAKICWFAREYHQLLLLDPENIDILTDMTQIYSEIKQVDFCFQMAQRLKKYRCRQCSGEILSSPLFICEKKHFTVIIN